MIVVGLHAAAFADEVEPTNSSSTTTYTNQFYIALGAGISRVYPEDECPCIAVGEPLSGGVSLAIGYDFARWLSAEAYIADLGSSSIDFFDQDVGDVDYQVFGASLLATFYRSDSGFGFNNNSAAGRKGLSLYGRVGVGGLETTTDLDFRRDHPQHVAFGLGMEYGMNRGFSVRGELISFDTDAQLLQVSLVKRFGGKRRSGSVQNVAAPVIAAPDETPKSAVVVAPGADLPKTYFAFDQHELTPEANGTVARIASILKEIEGTIQIDGPTLRQGERRIDGWKLRFARNRFSLAARKHITSGFSFSVRSRGCDRPCGCAPTGSKSFINRWFYGHATRP